MAIILFIFLGWLTSLAAISGWYGVNLNQKKSELVFANSAFMTVGLFGIFIGNLMTGILMQLIGKEAFVLVIASASVLYLFFVMFMNRRNSM